LFATRTRFLRLSFSLLSIEKTITGPHRQEAQLLVIDKEYLADAYFGTNLKIRDRFPQDWAATQCNLGVAYYNLPTGDRAKNLQQAIECLNAALRVRTEKEFPQDWAKTMRLLGEVHWESVADWQSDWAKYGWERDAMRQLTPAAKTP
jgi:hypothetical protein